NRSSGGPVPGALRAGTAGRLPARLRHGHQAAWPWRRRSGSGPTLAMKALVFGASGVIGLAATRHFASLPGWEAVGVSRRTPADLGGATHLSVDLTDREHCQEVLGSLRDVTHVVYAALEERPGLVTGWRDRDLMERNLSMFRNALD